jgi:Domain of unknown function (DUF4357)
VYFLFGSDEETAQEAVYIGEAEVVLDRLYSHVSGKDFWSELIAFTSKDDNLTKGHVRYLESRLIQTATDAARYVVKNSALPQLPALPRSDRDAMEEYLEATRVLLGVLGHKVLEPLVAPARVITGQPEAALGVPAQPPFQLGSPDRIGAPVVANFRLQISGLSAYATKTDEGLVVLPGSEASVSVQSSLTVGYRTLRERLLQSGVLAASGSALKFTRKHLFNSPSQAAAMVVGYSINGRDAWRLPDGTTYAAYEERLAQAITEASPAQE